MITDIRISTTVFAHAKIVKLERRLGAPGVISLIKLWIYTAQHREKGVLYDMTAEDIAIAAGWSGDEDKFVAELLGLKLIELNEGIYEIHNWCKHNPFAAFSEVRSEAGRKGAAARWQKDAGAISAMHGKNAIAINEDGNRIENDGKPMANRIFSDAPSPAPSPAPTPTPAPFPFSPPTPSPTPERTEALAQRSEDEQPKKEKSGGQIDAHGKKTIPVDWQPMASTLEGLAQFQIPVDFAEREVMPFRLWHTEAATLRIGFESLFVGWVRKAWNERAPPPGQKAEPIYTSRPRHMTIAEWTAYQERLNPTPGMDEFLDTVFGAENQRATH